MTSLPRHYRDLLRSELALRFQKNPRYSLRAFARDLSLSSARLSEVMSGKKGLSRAAAHKIAQRLGLNETEQSFFCDLVDSEHARSQPARKEAKARVAGHDASTRDPSGAPVPAYQIHQLTLDTFRYVEDWYHVAILQYLKIDRKPRSPQAIAREFGLAEFEVKEALDRMVRLELLEQRKNTWVPLHNWTLSGAGIPSRSIRKHHEQLIDQSKKALHLLPLDRRTFRSSVFSTEPGRLPEIEERIKRFSLEIIEQFSTTNSASEVVALTLQFFPLTQGGQK
jgi:uncharacterized protein (TIGR02147 family)